MATRHRTYPPDALDRILNTVPFRFALYVCGVFFSLSFARFNYLPAGSLELVTFSHRVFTREGRDGLLMMI